MKNLIWISFLIALFSCTSTTEKRVSSPNWKNSISISLDENGSPLYSITSYGEQIVSPSKLGLDLKNEKLNFENGLMISGFSQAEINETYELPTGKTKIYHNHANTGSVALQNKNGEILTINLRAYDDGVAFNYELQSDDSVAVKSETTEINLASTASDCWAMDYFFNYESFYPKRSFDSISNKELSYPTLVNLNKKSWLIITEAAVYDQPATHLIKSDPGNHLTIAMPEAFSVGNHYVSPWRTFILGQDLGTIVQSVIVENLNPPTEIKDLSWIDPGIAVFPWWGDYLANSYIDTLKMYVDMAAEMKWKWIEFDVSLVNSPWRTSKEWRTTAWLPEFTAYAKSKGIKVYGWDEINVLTNEMDYVYGRYRDLGIQGIKIDYIDSDKAYAMRFRDRAMREAAKYKLHVSFHGETLARGQRRKYPNVMTLEGVRGSEYYTFKDAQPPTPTHNCTLSFTRNVVGPMDYTPVTFTIRNENPRITTYAHELALPIIFESGWVAMADRPKAYLNSPAKLMLQQMKATWDETVFIDGYPGEFVCLARRNGNDWYLAAINASEEREISIPLDFLKKGEYDITLYKDNKSEPLTNIEIVDKKINSAEPLKIKLLKNGGFCTIFKNAHQQ
jgi:alpha-glucosidase